MTMKKAFLFLALAAITGSAAAGNSIDTRSYSAAGAVSNASTSSIAGAASGSATSGNAQNLSVTSPGTVAYSGEYKVKNVPDVTTIIPGMTAPCMIAVGIGGAGAGFGFGVGGGMEDKECTRRETARSLAALGKQDAAVRLFCGNPEVAALLTECAAPAPAPTGPQVSYNPTTRSTKVGGGGFAH
jgi:hypothetical protein